MSCALPGAVAYFVRDGALHSPNPLCAPRSQTTVKRAEKYAKGVDAAENAVPGAREEILTGRIKATDAEITALAKTPKAEIPAALAELRKPKQERQPRKAETSSSKQTLSEISKSIQGHQRQLTTEERTFLKASIDNRYQERAVANGSLMMCEVQGEIKSN